MNFTKTFGAIAAVGLLAAGSQAGSVLQFDVNALTADTGGAAFSDSYNGTLSMDDNIDSTLADMLIDGVAQNIASDQLADFTGSITFVNGDVTGGSFSITDTSGNIYMATIISGGSVIDLGNPMEPGQFLINGFTFMGEFSTNTFAGVDISLWADGEPLAGSFLEFKFTPDGSGLDNDTDIDVFVVVPAPAPVALAGLGLVGLAARRRRI